MASDFKIAIHRNSENLHLKLFGDFDVTSAQELFDVMEAHCKDSYRVFVHTNSLGNISPQGCEIFRGCVEAFKGQKVSFVFTGAHASHITP